MLPTSMSQPARQPETEIAVLGVRLETLDDKVGELKTELSGIRKEIKESGERTELLIQSSAAATTQTVSEISTRVTTVERRIDRWKWMAMGALGVISTVGSIVGSVVIKIFGL